MKILVTGGAGFIASHIVDAYISQGHDVSVIDNLTTGKKENLNPKAKFYKLDICDKKVAEVFKKEKPAIVNHHAAQMDVRKSVADPIYDAQINIMGTLNLLENAVKNGTKKVIFASSGGTIYGEPQYLPADENHPIAPIVPYGVSKYGVELYLRAYAANHELKYTVLRYGNVYGPRQDPHGEAGVVAIFIGKMLKGETPTIFGDGEQLRDYVYVDDVVAANLLAGDKGNNAAYNVGMEKGASVNLLFKILKGFLKFPKEAIYGPKRTGELEKVYLKCSKIKEEMGWQSNVSLEEGLAKTVEFFRSSKA